MFIFFADSTNAFVDALLYGFGYTTDLDDKSSQRFINLEQRFCRDVRLKPLLTKCLRVKL